MLVMVFICGLVTGIMSGLTGSTSVQSTRLAGTASVQDREYNSQHSCARTALLLNASDLSAIHSLSGPSLGIATDVTFPGTRVPRRVVVTQYPPIDRLQPALILSIRSWLDDTSAPGVELVYYDDAASREFLAQHYPAVVVNAWDALIPGHYAYKADLFRYAELLINGGVYVDAACTLRAPLTELVGYNGSIVISRAHSHLSSGVE